MSKRKTVVLLVISLITLVAVPLFWYGREGQSSEPETSATGVVESGPTGTPGPPAASATPPARSTPSPAPVSTTGPVELVVRRVGLRMPVVPTGVAADGQMELPANPARIGWYRFGPAPGATAGSVVFGGHLDSRRYGLGPLARLSRVRAGDLIEVRLTDGRILKYRTEAVRDVDKQTLALDAVFDRSGPRRLQLVTCGGLYLPARGGYQQNLVVTAVPVE